MIRCLDGLAEIALAAGDASRCRAYAEELLAVAEPNGLREIEAVARRWRGEALLVTKAYGEARAELTRAAALADTIGRLRLQMDLQSALARLSEGQDQPDAARLHRTRAHAIAQDIASSLASSGLEVQFRMLSDSR